jgi:hypothetical protein
MSNLLEISHALLEKHPNDPDAVELRQVAQDISAAAQDMIMAINVATHEEEVYRTLLTVANSVGPDTADDAAWLSQAADDADRQGELADAAAKQVEALGRELAKRVLFASSHA